MKKETKVWNEGKNGYRKVTRVIDRESKDQKFHIELLDVEQESYDSVYDIFYDHLSGRQTKFVEVMYSGGLDSEVVLMSCIHNKIPVKAMTMRLMVNGYPINTHDLYYSERFCRQNDIEHKIIDMNVNQLYESGDYIQYLEPYNITKAHVATQYKLITESTGYAVFGGDYYWPWAHLEKPIISPFRIHYGQYQRFMDDNSIHGIGNMIGHSIESMSLFINTHVSVFDDNIHNASYGLMPQLKLDIMNKLGFNIKEPRLRSYGWETTSAEVFNLKMYDDYLSNIFGETENSVTWNKTIADAMHSDPGTNNRFK
jgi:hypothetical protein